MGLDMYAYATSRKPAAPVDFKDDSEDEFHRWRSTRTSKAIWPTSITPRAARGDVQLRERRIDRDDLDALERVIKEDKLPETCGFFFGETTAPSVRTIWPSSQRLARCSQRVDMSTTPRGGSGLPEGAHVAPSLHATRCSAFMPRSPNTMSHVNDDCPVMGAVEETTRARIAEHGKLPVSQVARRQDCAICATCADCVSFRDSCVKWAVDTNRTTPLSRTAPPHRDRGGWRLSEWHPRRSPRPRPRQAAEKTERVHIALEPSELIAIDDYRFSARIPTRSEASAGSSRRGLRRRRRSVEASPPGFDKQGVRTHLAGQRLTQLFGQLPCPLPSNPPRQQPHRDGKALACRAPSSRSRARHPPAVRRRNARYRQLVVDDLGKTLPFL